MEDLHIQPGSLRRRAEDAARGLTGLRPDQLLSFDDMQQMLHELQVHQIELEMQNDQLRTTQAELDAQRARYFDLYDLAPVGYCTVNSSGLILQANLKAATLLGMARGSLVRQPLSRFIARPSQDAYYFCRQQVKDTDYTQECELQLVGQETDPQWVSLAMAPNRESAKESGLVGADQAVLRMTLTDVTDAKVMTLAMRDSEERYRAMVEWSPDAIMVHRERKILYCNAAALKLFGARHAHELVNRDGMELVHPDFHDAVAAKLRVPYHLNEVSPMVEEVLLKLDGSPMHVDVQMLAIMFKGARAVQVTMRDVTERRNMLDALQVNNLALQNARAEADKANQAKSDFLSSMSHELRTPLHAILGFAQLIEAGDHTLPDTQKRNLDQILKAGWYLLSLINEVLDLAQVESGKLALGMACVPLNELLIEVQALMEPLALQHQVQLSFPPFVPPHFLMADRHRVKQVLINLLSNAIKYNRLGGSVSVSLQEQPEERLRVLIKDTGEGLSVEQLAQLFQPFNRLGRENSTEEGTGIGLIMCKRLIDLMGGRIGANSSVGEGCTFWFELDMATSHCSTIHADGDLTPSCDGLASVRFPCRLAGSES